MASKRTVWFLIIFLGASLTLFLTLDQQPVQPSALLGDVGITVGIAANPYNTLSEQLNEEQTQLAEQSSALAMREDALANSASTSSENSPVVWYLAIAVTFIGILVLLNFYLDWRRMRRPSPPRE